MKTMTIRLPNLNRISTSASTLLPLAYISATVAWPNAIGWRCFLSDAGWMNIVHVVMTLPDGDVSLVEM